jgi:hypothetical protein
MTTYLIAETSDFSDRAVLYWRRGVLQQPAQRESNWGRRGGYWSRRRSRQGRRKGHFAVDSVNLRACGQVTGASARRMGA